ncbi:MBL fold metallo-hydrolase [Chengkuizengella axinellae]
MKMSTGESIQLMREFLFEKNNRKPSATLPIEVNQLINDSKAKVIWFGHSAVLVEIEGKTLFLDPMLGKAPTPFPIFAGQRYSEKIPIEIQDLPYIDAVLLSHDHYDHLDYGTIRKLKNKVGKFYVPLGVGNHLIRWGVDKERIHELDWWDEMQFDNLTIACTPSIHFSGRNINDRNKTLWCSWVISGETTNLYFSGDSGFGSHFSEIGKKYGPFDLTLMECGQYDERWSAIHMTPEETVQAQLDVNGKMLIPIHWGAFTLSLHEWTDPITRVTTEAIKRNVKIATPKIGEVVHIHSDKYPNTSWWKEE